MYFCALPGPRSADAGDHPRQPVRTALGPRQHRRQARPGRRAVRAFSSMRSYCTPGGKSAAVSMARSRRAPGHVGVPWTTSPQPHSDDGEHHRPRCPGPSSHHCLEVTQRLSADVMIGRARRAVVEQVHDRVDVEVGGKQVGHHVELRVARVRHVDVVGDDEARSARRGRRIGQPRRRTSSLSSRPCQCVPKTAPRRRPTPSQSSALRCGRPVRGGSRSRAGTAARPTAPASCRRRRRCRRRAGRVLR